MVWNKDWIMSDKRSHRGPAPEDEQLFSERCWPELRSATRDLCWLLSRGYAPHSAAELVGNRYTLRTRQRVAVMRCACSDSARQRRTQVEVKTAELKGRSLWLDGFNVLTAIEAALSGGIILKGSDGSYRDMASVYARHHQVSETEPALSLVGQWTQSAEVRDCHWWLDRPVSNSGRLQRTLEYLAAAHGWNWQVELVWNPDRVLAEATEIIATSDSVILDRCHHWINLTRAIIDHHVPQARIVDLSPPTWEA
jgi:hypothetical protein